MEMRGSWVRIVGLLFIRGQRPACAHRRVWRNFKWLVDIEFDAWKKFKSAEEGGFGVRTIEWPIFVGAGRENNAASGCREAKPRPREKDKD
jgi:hypothetical protein